jgi:hypothetical protein
MAANEGWAIAAPGVALLIPADGVAIALVTENTAENNIMFNALNLKSALC